MRAVVWAVAALLVPFCALAGTITGTPTAGTITTGGTFQTALAANAGRKSCTVVNTSTHTLAVYAGAAGSASLSSSFLIAPAGTFNCNVPGGVITNEIAVTTSATGDTFVTVSAQ